jgi:hypothetical protein
MTSAVMVDVSVAVPVSAFCIGGAGANTLAHEMLQSDGPNGSLSNQSIG